MLHVFYTLTYLRLVSGITFFSQLCVLSVHTLPIKKKVPLGVSANDREQANYPIYNVLGTKTNTRVTQISQSYNIFTIVCDFKHIHTHDLNTALVFFTLQR